MGRPRRIAAVAGVLFLMTAGPAQAYSIGGSAWPDATVTYFATAKGYSSPVNRAARILSRAGVGVQLQRVSSRAAAARAGS